MSGRWTWNPDQRRTLIVLLILMFGFLAFRLVMRPAYVADPQPPEGSRAMELEDRIDPNRAEWPTLAALPLIGEKRARDIVAYRELFVEQHPGQAAFARPADLMNIRGIGEVTVAQIEPFLVFPQSSGPPASGPD